MQNLFALRKRFNWFSLFTTAFCIVILAVSQKSWASTTYTTRSSGITIDGRISGSSNLGVLTSNGYNYPETIKTEKIRSNGSTYPANEVTDAQIGVPGSVDLVVYSQTYEHIQTTWRDPYDFIVFPDNQLYTDGMKYLLYTANVSVSPSSHFVDMPYELTFRALGNNETSLISLPGSIGSGSVLRNPAALPSIYLAGPDGKFNVMDTTVDISTFPGQSLSSYYITGKWTTQGNTSFSVLLAAGPGAGISFFLVDALALDSASSSSEIGVASRQVLSSYTLPALPVPTSPVPEPEIPVLAIAGALITWLLLQRRNTARN